MCKFRTNEEEQQAIRPHRATLKFFHPLVRASWWLRPRRQGRNRRRIERVSGFGEFADQLVEFLAVEFFLPIAAPPARSAPR